MRRDDPASPAAPSAAADPAPGRDDDLGVIASLVVQARPARLAAVVDAIQAREDAEIAAFDPAGKLAVVLETADDAGLAAAAAEINALPGVLGVSLVFHHSDPGAGIPPSPPDQGRPGRAKQP